MQNFNIKNIGITGLPGSGKTFVCNIFKNLNEKIKIFNADQFISEIYSNKNLYFEFFSDLNWFHQDIFSKNNIKFNLKKEIIKNPKILKDLESKLHPFVYEKIKNEINLNKDYLMIFEVPLLFESKMNDLFDINILIKADEKIRSKRLSERPGFDKNLYEIFLKSHFLEDKKGELSNFIILNDQNHNSEDLEIQIKNLISDLKSFSKINP